MKKISFVIATYNKSHIIEDTLLSALKAAKKFNKSLFEIIVIDDCSQDDTVKKIKKFILINKFFFIKIFLNKKNIGFSKSILKAVRLCSGSHIKILHAANIENEKDILKYLYKAQKVDLVLTNFIDKRVFYRRLISSLCSNTFCLISGKKISYFNSAILTKKIFFLENYPKYFIGNFFLSVIISRLLIKNTKFKEVKIFQKHPKKGSKAITIMNLISFFHAILLVFLFRISKFVKND